MLIETVDEMDGSWELRTVNLAQDLPQVLLALVDEGEIVKPRAEQLARGGIAGPATCRLHL